jgi:2-keto-4-pentenoate hydratase/2-oxohepta-3-ene-1,7-dioic acid hydratase in catechol pathway
MPSATPLTNFVTYLPQSSTYQRVGHLDLSSQTITPLSHPSGTPLTTLYEVINAGKQTKFIPSSKFDSPIPLASVTLLPPISGRDVLAVGKNYVEHAKEFNKSGYDSSDKVDIPSHPVIFTKRASSIVASGTEIFPHAGWTTSLDYEGEIGVILGSEGFGIGEEEAWDYVW